MKGCILYVEDDVNLSFVTKDNLELAHFQVIHCTNGADAWTLFGDHPFDLCILDVMLPQTDGFTLARQIRQVDPDIPILFLSALADKENRLNGLRLGADDYLTKPFSIEELLLKMAVFLRRSKTTTPISESAIQWIGSYQFNFQNLTLQKEGHFQTLTHREAEVLNYLIARPNLLIRRDEILKTIWGSNDYFMGRSLDVFISRLRKRLSQDASIKIENLHGIGFRLLL
ncbi:response regulator transcription factor [Larkinella rosea]|uniref:DNA-binding response regulator n=1 Tax=Larkinella rosea TaxID=2025312 RepID=A0A3P1BFV5_9BACT|nr:response regulator transcription factor [Larkinella rosea]RRA99801.1 DNA-binding response regulator [Larkinella rosea]